MTPASSPAWRRAGHLAWRGLYYLLPVVILTVILWRIDLAQFGREIGRSDPWLVAAGVLATPIGTLIGAARWIVLLRVYGLRQVPLGYALRHFWIGLGVGVLTPGSLGWDAYRVVVIGRRFGRYLANAAMIVVEKVSALIAAGLFVVILFPVLPFQGPTELIEAVRLGAIAVLAGFAVLVFAVLVARQRAGVARLILKVEGSALGLVDGLVARIAPKARFEARTTPPSELIAPVARVRPALNLIAASAGIQAAAALRIWLFFLAVGADVPFVACLFVMPILFLLFTLPISFGSIGVREGGFIVLFGLFGVAPETALWVSVLGLTQFLINGLISGVLLWLDRGTLPVDGSRGPTGKRTI